MFLKSSRYASVPTVAATGADGQTVSAVRLRVPPATVGNPRAVKSGDQLDVMAQDGFGDATRFWHIADANTEIEANALVARHGRVIRVPER